MDLATVDVTVMGAGVFGLSIAYACLKRGACVRVIDPRGIGAGASGGIVGALAPHVPEQWNAKKQFQFESLIMSRAFWPKLEESVGASTGYSSTGRLQPLADAAAVALAQSRSAGSATLWRDKAKWEIVPAKGHGWEPPSGTGQLISDTLSAHIHPRLATGVLGKAIVALGGEIVQDASAQGRVVWATGWEGLTEMTLGHHRQIGNGVKGQAALLEFDAPGAPQLFVDTLHIIPHTDGTVAIGSTSERDFDAPDKCDGALDDIIERARAAVPVLKDAPVLTRWAGVRPRSRSRAPMLGHHPFRKAEFVANGGFKIGFGMAPKVGEVMADLILEDRVTYPAEFEAAASL